ncbi:MAG: hypothetical protein WCF85_01310 [Rhodospirillaceae bacterium]
MAAIAPIVSTALPVFSAVNGYFNTQDRLNQQADNAAAKLQLQQQQAAERAAEKAQAEAEKAQAEAERRQKAAEVMASEQQLQMQQLDERQAADALITNTGIQNRMDQAQLDANEAERQRRLALSQATAKTTVSLAGQGIDPNDGSAAAIRLGQISNSDQQRQAADQANRLRLQALSQQAEDATKQNLLERSQLAERQRLQWLNSFS